MLRFSSPRLGIEGTVLRLNYRSGTTPCEPPCAIFRRGTTDVSPLSHAHQSHGSILSYYQEYKAITKEDLSVSVSKKEKSLEKMCNTTMDIVHQCVLK